MDPHSRPSRSSHRTSHHHNDHDSDTEDGPPTTSTTPSRPQQHPLQVEHQQQPWLIPHPNLPISWRDNDRPQFHNRNEPHHPDQAHSVDSPPLASSSNSLLRLPFSNRPTLADTESDPSSRPDAHVDIGASSHMEGVDQGHESDPSELLRAPVLYSSSPPRSLVGQDMYPIRRPNRSMSLSIPPNPWHNERVFPTPAPSRTHREVVPYTQEWRVILRSPPRGRTVLYNPQMQSLVVQTTVGLDQPMSLRNDARICVLCRRPLDLDTNAEGEDVEPGVPGFMDTNYFRMLADANVAISRRASLQDQPSSQYRTDSTFGSPTSSSRASLDLDAASALQTESNNNTQASAKSPHLSHNALNQGYYNRFFTETKKLGRGFRGSVFLCQHILDGIHLGEYAIKKVAVGDNHDWLVQMLREVHLLERLHHPNIVSYKHAWLENHQLHQFSPEVTCLFILMECANGGNLEEYIERSSTDPFPSATDPDAAGTGSSKEHEMSVKERLLSEREERRQRRKGSIPALGKTTETTTTSQASPPQHTRHYLSNTEIWSFFFDICEGLAHLHRLGIIHRDLKPPNLLLSFSNSKVKGSQGERPRILITDFGECEIIDQDAKRDRTGATGTLEFLAPELLAVDDHGRYTNEFSFKGDMWSLGMVLYYLCYSRLPYSQIEDVDVLREEIKEFKTITLPPDDERVIPEELKILIRVLLSTDKSKRPSCDDILSTLSHQRDRMMHGDMDSPTTPIVSSSSLHAANGKAGIEVDHSEDDKAAVVSGSTKSPIAQHLHPMPHRLATPGRRRSRVTLITEPSARSVHRGRSPGAIRDATASPSLNLHKKVKPLGLGLRHILRRQRLHFPSPNIHRSSTSPVDNDGSMSLSIRGSPMPTGAPTIGSPGVAQQNARLFQRQQNIRDRQESAKTRESALGLAMHLPNSRQSSDDLHGHPDQNKDKAGRSASHQGSGHTQTVHASPSKAIPRSNPSNSSSTRRKKQPRDTKTATLSSESSDTSDNEVDAIINSKSRRPSTGSKTKLDTSANRLYRNQDQSYWSHLASNHQNRNASLQEKANNGDDAPQLGDDTTSVSTTTRPPHTAADEMSADTVEGSGVMSAEHEANKDMGSPPDLTVVRTTRRRPHRRNSHQGTEKSVATLNSTQRGSSTHSFSSSPSTSSDDFSFHFMFTSLLVRIWFCLRICHPIVVRPLVLYPVLVLTVVWDRYLMSLWTESSRALLSSRSTHSPPRRSTDWQTRRRILEVEEGEGKDVGEGGEGMAASPSTDQMMTDSNDGHDSRSSNRALRPASVSVSGTGSEAVRVVDDNSQASAFGTGSWGSIVTLMWQAGLLGVAVQLLWIGVVWMLSRDGICAL
ncbi:hypothetical protein EMPS_06550 [Entomortierella parvispora]|uniref:non-specific serine/threonine protein kinase n=1 Tax=Entomortierella parvispora TaxID=205924 RepID=A0A9P3HD63_9FUNG|nr:hypothetical protein EMPS_06550 [Entomortierella parvispora]